MRRPVEERPVANGVCALVSDGWLAMPTRCTRPAAQTSCGSSASTYCSVLPARTTGSLTACAKFVGVETVSVPAPTAATVVVSAFGATPIAIVSPMWKPLVSSTGIEVAPFATPGTPIVDAPPPEANTETGMTVQ